MTSEWLFDQPPNAAAITSSDIIRRQAAILHVSHYSDDDSWAFLTGEPVSEDEAKVVSMQAIVNIDQTVIEVADLPPGWSADRTAVGEVWTRYENSQI